MEQNTALLVMDIQGPTINMMGENSASLIESLTKAIQASRANKIPVIYVVVGFRKGFPEVSPDNKSFARLKTAGMNFDMEESSRVHASVAADPDEIVVVKKRVSAFAGSDLEVILRAKGIKHIILTGIATSGVVLSTLRAAADMDYKITVLSDGCADMDEEVNRVLLTKIFPRQADVLTVDEWVHGL